MNLTLGINKEISNEDYHKDRNFESSSSLKLFLKDSREYYKRYILKEEQAPMYKSAYDFGSYIHSLILEPEKTDDEFIIFEGLTRRGKAWTEFKEANQDKIIITKSQELMAISLISAYKDNADTKGLIQDGHAEHTLCTNLEGLDIKVRADYIKEGMVIDVKTTSEPVDKFSAAKTIVRFDYDLSAALYIDAFRKYTGKELDFLFIFLNKQNNDIAVLKASTNLLENGRRKYKAAIKGLLKARSTGIFYEEGVQEVDIPTWAEFKDGTDTTTMLGES
jgi:hypothetical protein